MYRKNLDDSLTLNEEHYLPHQKCSLSEDTLIVLALFKQGVLTFSEMTAWLEKDTDNIHVFRRCRKVIKLLEEIKQFLQEEDE